MKLFTSNGSNYREKTTKDGQLLFTKQAKGFDGFSVTIDGTHFNIPMIIQKHTNPLNKNLHDMKAKYLNTTGNFMHIGNIVEYTDLDSNEKICMAATEPSSNGIYSEYKIIPINEDVKFSKDSTIVMRCAVANKGFYNESSFVNETTVFEDKELRAALLQYNPTTKSLVLFDDIFINDNHYKIVKIDDYTFKEYDEEYGVLQLVIIDTPFGKIVKNDDVNEIKGIVMNARVKDKILNSISRELVCEHNQVERGDYINFTYDRDEKGMIVTEVYLVTNKPTMGKNYDISLLYLCENTMNLLDSEGDVVNVPLYFEDNRMRVDKVSDNEFMKFRNSSYMAMCQYNDTTKRLKNKVNRVIVGDEVYSITGTDATSKGLLVFGLELDKINTNDDNLDLGIANYNSQMEEINKTSPSQPSESIVGANDLCKGYTEEYSIPVENQVVTWSVDCDYVKITSSDNKCILYFNDLKQVNKTFTLSATYGTTTLTKSITTVNL